MVSLRFTLQQRSVCISPGVPLSHQMFIQQMGHAEIVTCLLDAGADPGIETRVPHFETPRQLAKNQDVIDLIDQHQRRQLRSKLVDICTTLLAAADVPALVLLECFEWSASTTRAAQHVSIPLETQWRIAKTIRDRAANYDK